LDTSCPVSVIPFVLHTTCTSLSALRLTRRFD